MANPLPAMFDAKETTSGPDSETAATLEIRPGMQSGVHPAFAPTVVSPGEGEAAHPAAPAPTSTLPPGSAGTRNTVLPRVELIGDEPTLVVDAKLRFEPLRALGEGGVGEVVGARDNDIGRTVALKRLRADMRNTATLVRFVEEIRTIGRLEHPNIIPIHDVGLDEAGQYYFVMKYVDGETLETIIDKLARGDQDYHRRYPFERRVQIFASILDAIAFAHDKGIVHRDIKPANIMIGAYGEVVVMDWGIAKSLREPSPGEAISPLLPRQSDPSPAGRAWKTQMGTLIGTPAYMSPEQAMGLPVDERSDIYALSVLFYEFLSLTHPLAGKVTLTDTLAGVIREEPRKLYDVKNPYQGGVPVDLVHFVDKGLSKKPEDRFASVAEMRYRLQRRAEGHIPIECAFTLTKLTLNSLTRFLDNRPKTALGVLVGVFLMVLWALGTTLYHGVHA